MNVARLCMNGKFSFPVRRNLIFNYRFCDTNFSNRDTYRFLGQRYIGSNSPRPNLQSFNTTKNYVVAVGIVVLGFSFAAVPLYRIFCQASGFGGTVQHDIGGEKIKGMKKNFQRKITVRFNSDVSTNMKWKFEPQQNKLVVVPGETALAFYTATNPTDKPIIGVSTYNILPFNAAQYFNKIQCFCFEEQQLNPKEKVDMPVFFYIDPEFCEDPQMENVDEVILSYTFFEAKGAVPVTINKLQGVSSK